MASEQTFSDWYFAYCQANNRTPSMEEVWRAALATQPAESKACASVGAREVADLLQDLWNFFAGPVRIAPTDENARAAMLWKRIEAALASPAPSVGAPLITVESSLRFRLEGAQQKVRDLEEENRELRGRPPSRDLQFMFGGIATPPAAPATGEFDKLVAETFNDPGMAEARAWARDALTQAPAAPSVGEPVAGNKFQRAWLQLESLPGGMMMGSGGLFGPVPASTSTWVTTSERERERLIAQGKPMLEVWLATPPAAPAATEAPSLSEGIAKQVMKLCQRACVQHLDYSNLRRNNWNSGEALKARKAYRATLDEIESLVCHLATPAPAVGASVQPVLASLSDERKLFEGWIVREAGPGAIEKWLGTEGYENARGQDYRTGWVACLDALASSTPTKGGEAS